MCFFQVGWPDVYKRQHLTPDNGGTRFHLLCSAELLPGDLPARASRGLPPAAPSLGLPRACTCPVIAFDDVKVCDAHHIVAGFICQLEILGKWTFSLFSSTIGGWERAFFEKIVKKVAEGKEKPGLENLLFKNTNFFSQNAGHLGLTVLL